MKKRSGILTNDQLIVAYRGRRKFKARVSKLRAKVSHVERQLETLKEKLEYLEGDLEQINSVTSIRDGIACGHNRYGGNVVWGNVVSIGKDIGRRAQVYLNAHNKTTWCIKLRDTSTITGESETWCGSNWPSKRIAIQVCYYWITHNQGPINRVNVNGLVGIKDGMVVGCDEPGITPYFGMECVRHCGPGGIIKMITDGRQKWYTVGILDIIGAPLELQPWDKNTIRKAIRRYLAGEQR